MTTPTAAPCALCGTLGGSIHHQSCTPTRIRHLCQQCYDAARWRGTVGQWPTYQYDDHPTVPTGIITAAMLGITPGQPPTDPALTPAKVWEIAHRNATRATHWLVNTGRMTPDEAAALVYLTYAPPADAARAAA